MGKIEGDGRSVAAPERRAGGGSWRKCDRQTTEAGGDDVGDLGILCVASLASTAVYFTARWRRGDEGVSGREGSRADAGMAAAATAGSTEPELTCFGARRVVVTAPHCIPLCRDSHPVHKKEEYTRLLALKFAAALHGAALTWSKETADRLGPRPDPSLRDPNHLRVDELTANRWSQRLSRLVATEGSGESSASESRHAKMARELQNQEDQVSKEAKQREPRSSSPRSRGQLTTPTLHIDVHGARNPCPDGHRAHIHLGLMAMKRSPSPRVRDACEKLRSALAAELATWSHEFCEVAQSGVPSRGSSSSTGPLLNGYPIVQANPQERLTGALDSSTGRVTMTQQSVLYGCSHAVQVELSHTVREVFAKKDKGCQRVRASFARAIGRAWARVTAQPSPRATRSPRTPRSARTSGTSLPVIVPRQPAHTAA